MDKEDHDHLDYEPEDVINDSTTGAEDAELELSNLKLVEEEVSSMDAGPEAIPDHPCTEGASALSTTPGTSPQKNVLDPKLGELINQLVESKVGHAMESSEARLRAAECEILSLREELQKDQAKLSSFEAKEAEKKKKRKERKARKKTSPEQAPIPEKRQKTSLTSVTDGPSQEELTTEDDLAREIEFHHPGAQSEGNNTTLRVHEWLSKLAREKQLRRHNARKMEGLTPTEPATGEMTNPDLWYNWRQSNKSRRIPHINAGWALAVLEFLGLERTTIKEMSVEAKDETYCVLVLMMKLCGLITLPPYLHRAYHNQDHCMDGAIRRLRWAVPRMTSYMGSDPATHIMFRYNVTGLPSHLRVFSKAVPRLNPSPPGSRSIDSRLTPSREAARNLSRRPRGEPSTRRRTSTAKEDTTPRAATPRAASKRSTEDPTPRPDNRVATEEPTPVEATEESGDAAVNRVEPEAMEVVEVPQVPAAEPLKTVEPVFAHTDLRESKERSEEQEEKKRKREKKKSTLTRMIQIYKENNLGAGTSALRKYLRSEMIPRKTCKELIPEEFDSLTGSDLDTIIARIKTLSNKALDAKLDKDDLKKKKLVKASTCGESIGQPTDSSAQEAETEQDLGDSPEEKSDSESSAEAVEAHVDPDEGIGSPSRQEDSTGVARRSRSPKPEKTKKLRSTVAKVIRKKTPKNPYHESKHSSNHSSSNTKTYTSSSSSSRSRYREDSSSRTVRHPDPRDYQSTRRGEEKRRTTKSHGRR